MRADPQKVLLPVTLSMRHSSGPPHPVIGTRYEAPYIGKSDTGGSKTNKQPAAMPMNLTATVSGLTPGKKYNLYMYKRSDRPLAKGVLTNVPTTNFNANAKMATSKMAFTAKGATFTAPALSVLSSDTVVYRCVPASAP